ncbi:hypothetical protein [Streptomyces qinzhouensis]|uniref:hypothetical protein n=1 Tax=Streptomyces qinzhouensis TaxID=2599401 RepID=UPI001FEAE939|nr:hypothetical protein [Streptomyces qinzhouensis]
MRLCVRFRLPALLSVTALTSALLAGHGTAGAQEPAADPAARATARPLPAVIDGGVWRSGHLQGMALDRARGFMYFSYTDALVKTDLDGRPIGSVTHVPGHLGDLDHHPGDGRVYGSLEHKGGKAFYVAVFDPRRITRMNMDARTSGVMTTVHLRQVADDYTADMNGDGVFDGNTGSTPDHRYGTSGIDGLSFGPALGSGDDLRLTVAYGVYSHTGRQDNDHQILLQYDITDWARYERPLDPAAPHRGGPAAYTGRYFVYTGNTTYGVQNLAWDPATRNWLLAVYRGKKQAFPNYTLFVVDGAVPARPGLIRGQPVPHLGNLLTLEPRGMLHLPTGIYGRTAAGQYGLVPVGDGTHYVAEAGTESSGGVTLQKGRAVLHRWTGAVRPFEPVVPPAPAGPRRPAGHAAAGPTPVRR